jgi:DNA-binding MarR family transcriptional regulator
MKREETIDYNIKYTWHAISRMYNQVAAKYGLTTAMGFVLINIDADEGTPATKIAPMLGLESRSLTRMLKTMEEKNLIFRKQDENDKRSVRIHLTADGVIGQNISKVTVRTFNEMVRDKVSKKELKTFFSVITKINQLIESQELIQYSNELIENET